MKTNIFITVIFQLFLISNLMAQVTQDWVQKYNVGDSSMSEARAIALDGAGNVYVTGRSTYYDSDTDFLTVKFNPDGVQQWVQRYNGPGNDEDLASFIAVDAAGNVYVSGSSFGDETETDYATVKYNTDGVQQWVQRYNGVLDRDDRVEGMGIDKWGNVYVTGTSYVKFHFKPDWDVLGTSITTVKYDPNGAQQWVKEYHDLNTINPGQDYAAALAVDNIGNVFVAGQSVGMGGPLSFNWECVTIKYNPYGDSLWVRTLIPDTVFFHTLTARAITVNAAGYVFVTGVYANSVENGNDYFTVKYNSSGDLEWLNMYNGPGNGTDQPSSIAADVNNVYVTGMSAGSNTGYDYATVKYDFSGVQQWVQRYNGPGNGNDAVNSIKLDASGYIYITGVSMKEGEHGLYDFATIKYDYFGNQKWIARYNGNPEETCGGYSLALNSYGDVFVAGVHADLLVGSFAIIKYSQGITDVKEAGSGVPEQFGLSQNFPNPFNSSTNITFSIPVQAFISLKIFDILGREVETLLNENMQAGKYTAQWNADKLTSGIYLYRLQSDKFSETRKLLLMK